MKPELSPVVLGLLIAGFAFAAVLALVRLHPAELEAPGLKFVSPKSLENRQQSNYELGSFLPSSLLRLTMCRTVATGCECSVVSLSPLHNCH